VELNHGWHLAYCTNIHRGETWAETLAALKTHTLAVRERVSPQAPFAIGLRLSDRAARELGERAILREFRRWLELNHCYIFTINGFPFGPFHGARVKEAVYTPDWTTPERLDYTKRLFDLLVELAPPGVAGSVSTLPGSFKAFIHRPEQLAAIRDNLWRCVEHLAHLSRASGRQLHLGLEPEPLCLLENSRETVEFFEQMRRDRPQDDRLDQFLGVNYDTCHLAVEFEEPRAALGLLREAGVKLSKIHLSSALKTIPHAAARAALVKFADEVYLHQVVARDQAGRLSYHRDLGDALAATEPMTDTAAAQKEWRIHFHVPLHAPASAPFANTTDHLLGALDVLAENPAWCAHLEMETYTWEVLPEELKSRSVVDQLTAEYAWTLARLAERGLAGRG
jgi:sugar phosphate isomerase/epimerase